MDSAGKNRYELLFMDDDISDPLDNVAPKKKQQQSRLAVPTKAAAKPQQANRKPAANQAEKENKPSAMNRNEANKRSIGAAGGDKVNVKQQQGGTANRKNMSGAKVNAAGEATVSGPVRNVNSRQQNGDNREQRNNRRNTRENGLNNAGGTAMEGGTQPQARQFRDRGENRAAPRQRNFEGGNNNREFKGKREFDRQSGSDKTGVKSVDKRDGAGAHNWGSVKETIDDGNKTIDAAAEGANSEAKQEESGNEQAEQAAAVEEETKELTLDEWKAQKQQRAKPQFNIRKAGEGEDTSQWKKMIALTNTKKKENESEEELEYDPAMYPQRVGRQQRVLDIQFNFNDGRRGGGGFGGRMRGRGGSHIDGAGPRGGANVAERRAPTVGERNFSAGLNSGPVGGNGQNAGHQRSGFDGPRFGRGGGGGGKLRNFGGVDRQQQFAVPKVNDESQFPTLS